MERLSKKMKGKKFKMVGVNQMEDAEKVKKFAALMGVTFDLVMDVSGDISDKYNANSLPLTYIIDKQGNIIRRAIGVREWDSPEAIRYFENLAAGPG